FNRRDYGHASDSASRVPRGACSVCGWTLPRGTSFAWFQAEERRRIPLVGMGILCGSVLLHRLDVATCNRIYNRRELTHVITFRSDIKAELTDQYGEDIHICRAAWVSSGKDDGHDESPARQRGLIRSLLRQKHGTPF